MTTRRHVFVLLGLFLMAGAADAGPRRAAVTLFMAPWCSYCMHAKAWMAREGIEYHEFNVDTDAGQSAFEDSGGTKGVPAGKRGIPYLLWNGKQIRGFTPEKYAAFFQK